MSRFTTQFKVTIAAIIFAVLYLMPAPEGLSPEGKKVMAIAATAVVLWVTEAVHSSVVGLVIVILLAVTAAVPTLNAALYGFSQPLVYFLFGVYVMALGAAKSGLAEKAARWLMAQSRGSIKNMYFQLLASFALFSFLVPSATTRNSIQLPAIDEAFRLAGYEKKNPAPRIIMLSLAALNRLGSTALLTGGIAPVTAAAFLGNFSWERWFILMAPSYYLMLLAGGLFIYFMYRPKNGYPANREDYFKTEQTTVFEKRVESRRRDGRVDITLGNRIAAPSELRSRRPGCGGSPDAPGSASSSGGRWRATSHGRAFF